MRLALGASLIASPVRADDHRGFPGAGSIVRVLGSRAEAELAPSTREISALFRVPDGRSADQFGASEIAPGIGLVRGSGRRVLDVSRTFPDLHFETSPPLHLLMDHADGAVRASATRSKYGLDGHGVVLGVADSGIDASHPDFRDANGKTRILWYLDLSRAPLGLHPELEQKFGIVNAAGALQYGAVMNKAEIDQALTGGGTPPSDEEGHGTHVTGIAAAGTNSPYVGIAPNADLILARVTRGDDSIEQEDMLRGASFIFDRADSLAKPAVVNLSLGTDFGPHDGTMLWEEALAAEIGPSHPGHAIVVAAGNSGSIAETPVHTGLRVSPGATFRVPIVAGGASNGGVQIWVAFRPGAHLSVGLEGPDGEWISPVAEGDQAGYDGNGFNAGVVHGDGPAGNPVPRDSRGAVVVWSGRWPAGTHYVELEGEGECDLYLQPTGDARGVGFLAPSREGTINLPAAHPDILSVGCTVNRTNWTSIAGVGVTFSAPKLDPWGGFVDPNRGQIATSVGDVCWFSSAGPNRLGVAKPEIAAPGGVVIASMSAQAPPSSARSVFHATMCPTGGKPVADARCLQIDSGHGVSVGTSMSAPMVAGAAALLFQMDPTLTQNRISMLLQAGAHYFRGSRPFEDQGGVGELDTDGAVQALLDLQLHGARLPDASRSWLTTSVDYARADGNMTVEAAIELRASDGLRADGFETSRLASDVTIAGRSIDSVALRRRGPGLWAMSVTVPAGTGGSEMHLGVRFDGVPVVPTKNLPIAVDSWNAFYPSTVKGGCTVAPVGSGVPVPSEAEVPSRRSSGFMVGVLVLCALILRRGLRSSREVRG